MANQDFSEVRTELTDLLRLNVPDASKLAVVETPGKMRLIAGPFTDGPSLVLQLILSFDEDAREAVCIIRSVDVNLFASEALLLARRHFREGREGCQLIHKCGPEDALMIRNIMRRHDINEDTYPKGIPVDASQWRKIVESMIVRIAR